MELELSFQPRQRLRLTQKEALDLIEQLAKAAGFAGEYGHSAFERPTAIADIRKEGESTRPGSLCVIVDNQNPTGTPK